MDACQVAVVDGDHVTHHIASMRKGQAERIAPMARDAMAQAGLGFDALDRIAVTVGPGSFAGVRVGLAFARGLAVALGRPCLGYTTLEAFARGDGDEGVRVGVISAPDGVFLGAWSDGALLVPPTRMPFEAAQAAIPAGARVFGPAADRFGGPASVAAPPIAALIRLAIGDDPGDRPADPVYLRPPYATLPDA